MSDSETPKQNTNFHSVTSLRASQKGGKIIVSSRVSDLLADEQMPMKRDANTIKIENKVPNLKLKEIVQPLGDLQTTIENSARSQTFKNVLQNVRSRQTLSTTYLGSSQLNRNGSAPFNSRVFCYNTIGQATLNDDETVESPAEILNQAGSKNDLFNRKVALYGANNALVTNEIPERKTEVNGGALYSSSVPRPHTGVQISRGRMLSTRDRMIRQMNTKSGSIKF